MKGSDLALIDHCSDTLGIAVGSRIVGECLTVSSSVVILFELVYVR